MDATIHAEWIAELRSGNHAQGTGHLKTVTVEYSDESDTYEPEEEAKPEFCCLGVLCEVAVRHEVIPAPERPEYDGAYLYGESVYDRTDTHLPEKVQEWSGLDWSPKVTVFLHGTEQSVNLVDLNDSHGWSFAQIADALEAAGPEGVLED